MVPLSAALLSELYSIHYTMVQFSQIWSGQLFSKDQELCLISFEWDIIMKDSCVTLLLVHRKTSKLPNLNYELNIQLGWTVVFWTYESFGRSRTRQLFFEKQQYFENCLSCKILWWSVSTCSGVASNRPGYYCKNQNSLQDFAYYGQQ